MSGSKFFSRFPAAYFFCLPECINAVKLLWYFFRRTPKTDASGLGYSNSLGLPFSDLLPFCLCNVRKYLQHQIRYKDTRQVQSIFTAGIQKRKVSDNDVGLLAFGDSTPLFDNLFIVPAQAVNGLYEKSVSRPQLSKQFLIKRPVKILSRLPVNKNIMFGYFQVLHHCQLPFHILIFGRYPDISIIHFSPSFYKM